MMVSHTTFVLTLFSDGTCALLCLGCGAYQLTPASDNSEALTAGWLRCHQAPLPFLTPAERRSPCEEEETNG